MTLRYPHLSPGPQLDTVQRLNPAIDPAHSDTRIDTSEPPSEAVAAVGDDVVELTSESSGGARSRTADLGIMSRSPRATPVHSGLLSRRTTRVFRLPDSAGSTGADWSSRTEPAQLRQNGLRPRCPPMSEGRLPESLSASDDPPNEGRDHDREVELTRDRLQPRREPS